MASDRNIGFRVCFLFIYLFFSYPFKEYHLDNFSSITHSLRFLFLHHSHPNYLQHGLFLFSLLKPSLLGAPAVSSFAQFEEFSALGVPKTSQLHFLCSVSCSLFPFCWAFWDTERGLSPCRHCEILCLAFSSLTISPRVISSVPATSDTQQEQNPAQCQACRVDSGLFLVPVRSWYTAHQTQRPRSMSTKPDLFPWKRPPATYILKSEKCIFQIDLLPSSCFFFFFWTPSYLFYPLFLICHFSFSLFISLPNGGFL